MATVNISNDIARAGLAGILQSVTAQFSAVSNPMATADTQKLIKLPPYAIIHSFQCVIDTGEGATATGDFGIVGDDITDDPNGLDDAVNLATAGVKSFGVAGTDAAIGLDMGASGGYITMGVDNALDAAIFTITVVYSQSQNA